MNVRALIRTHLAGADDPSPAAIARAVIDELTTPDEIAEALRAALPYLVRDESRKHRHTAIGRRADGERGIAQLEAATQDNPPEGALRSGYEEARKDAARRRAGGRKGFERTQARRERDSMLLQTPMSIGDGEWKPLGDCTATDLRQIASLQQRRVEENQRRRDAYYRLASALDKAGAATVRDYQGDVREAIGV